jgi:hypothetical protein
MKFHGASRFTQIKDHDQRRSAQLAVQKFFLFVLPQIRISGRKKKIQPQIALIFADTGKIIFGSAKISAISG